ncbi:MAG: hypothetical protein COV46_00210 [Deltaproteobacteria bacterium CG11_big_fil_rev_8_21_14_0_20_49_13]|nr:MAG: hypothetical protein COV46_00210 [Deltaproteobacteria bacterium CG11_big_fil_rev_8_21_14_0_20_49_13]
MNILKDVLSIPTAPFHEGLVAKYVKNTCKGLGLKIRSDGSGNLFVRYKKGRGKQPVILTSHMDHPGFEIIKGGDKKCTVGILGGVNLDFFAGARVAINSARGIIKGVVAKKPLKKKWMGKPTFEINCHPRASGDLVSSLDSRLRGDDRVRKGFFGWYDLPGYMKKKGLIITKAADNVASVAALLQLLTTLKKRCASADVTCVFTRAEEVGFVGCTALEKEKIFPKNVPIIVIECSSASGGKVEIGGGPVIRVGDKMSCYTPEVDLWLRSLSKKLKVQRALLAGGTCEASVWMLKGYRTGGLAFPLGNYHNNAEKTYGPEFISLKDYKTMQKLLITMALSKKGSSHIRANLAPVMKNYRLWGPKLNSR